MTSSTAQRVLAVPDTFRSTATAAAVATAICTAARAVGRGCRALPLADGGEGTVAALGGANRSTRVTGPDGRPVEAGWRLDGDRAVIEMAAASGLELVGGAGGVDPVAATTRGTGELIAAAIAAGAREVLVGLGGSATTDGGAGALQVLAPEGGPAIIPRGVRLIAATDVRTDFVRAAAVFGPQKGADAHQVELLTRRLQDLLGQYRTRFGVDLTGVERAGAAGGLAGGLAVLGAELVDGFAAIAARCGFAGALAAADLVVTGEGRLDDTSVDGKIVGEVVRRATLRGIPTVIVCGSADIAAEDVAAAVGAPTGAVEVISLTERYGRRAALTATTDRVVDALTDHFRRSLGGG